METTPHNSPETTAILQQMQEVRRELDEDVQEIVEDARDWGNWRSYVRSYPWVCLGAALAVGYWIVPRRRAAMQSDAGTLAELAKGRLLATSPASTMGTVRTKVLAFVGDQVLRGVTSYALQQASKLFVTPAAQSPQDVQP